jgi:hypothetical protein
MGKKWGQNRSKSRILITGDEDVSIHITWRMYLFIIRVHGKRESIGMQYGRNGYYPAGFGRFGRVRCPQRTFKRCAQTVEDPLPRYP